MLIALFFFSLDSGLVYLFHLGLEGNIPTMFSFFQFIFIGMLLATMFSKEKNLAFAIFSLGAFYIAFDEFFTIHERIAFPITRTLTTLFPGSPLSGFLTANPWNPWFAWLLLYIPLVILLIPFGIKFIRKQRVEHPKVIRIVLAGLIVFVTGGVGFELIEIAMRNEWLPLAFNVSVFFEEGLEMLGANIIIFGLLEYLESIKRKKNAQNQTLNP